MHLFKRLFVAAPAAAVLAIASPALAATSQDILIEIFATGEGLADAGMSETVVASDEDGDGQFDFGNLADIGTTGRWDFTEFSGFFFDDGEDPIISNSFDVTNLSAVDQTFTITISTITGPIGNPLTITGGSVQGGVTDANGGGATLDVPAGTSFYTALIDGAPFETLIDGADDVTVGAFLSDSFTPAAFGTPIPSFPGPAVTTSIGIEFQFTLSPGDRATGSGVFVVDPVPEPGTALLVGFGVLAIATIRRRR